MADNRSLVRGFKILESIGAAENALSVAEVSRLTGLHRATAHRLLSVLVDLGYVHKSPQSKRYTTGFYLHTFGRLDHVIDVVVDHCRPFLQNLAAGHDAVCHVGSLEGRRVAMHDVVAIGRRAAPEDKHEKRVNAYITPIGKALLAMLPEVEVEARFANTIFSQLTPRTINSLDSLKWNLRSVRKLGYAVCNNEAELGSISVGTALVNPSGRAICGISATIHADADITERRLKGLIEEVQQTRQKILDFMLRMQS